VPAGDCSLLPSKWGRSLAAKIPFPFRPISYFEIPTSWVDFTPRNRPSEPPIRGVERHEATNELSRNPAASLQNHSPSPVLHHHRRSRMFVAFSAVPAARGTPSKTLGNSAFKVGDSSVSKYLGYRALPLLFVTTVRYEGTHRGSSPLRGCYLVDPPIYYHIGYHVRRTDIKYRPVASKQLFPSFSSCLICIAGDQSALWHGRDRFFLSIWVVIYINGEVKSK